MNPFRWACTVIIITLVILGLNTSNQGINHLTMENRGAVVGVAMGDGSLCLGFAGNTYILDGDRLSDYSLVIKEQIQGFFQHVIAYLLKIWLIFKAVFLWSA